MKPRILKEFFERYRRAKFPSDVIAGNVLKTLGLPTERAQPALEIIKANGRYAGIIRETPTGPFVNLDSPGVPAPTATPQLPEHDVAEAEAETNATAGEPRAKLPRPLRGLRRRTPRLYSIEYSFPTANKRQSLIKSKSFWLSAILSQ
jgi:hypothetical protein